MFDNVSQTCHIIIVRSVTDNYYTFLTTWSITLKRVMENSITLTLKTLIEHNKV